MTSDASGRLVITGHNIAPGERLDIALEVAESYLGTALSIPIHVWRGGTPGPTLLVTAAVHGDEINGTGIVREVMLQEPFELVAGSLILVPVLNLLGFERHSRYMPDRRDLNRSFPGSAEGSLARRYADVLFTELVRKSDWLIDLHTPAVRRTDFPNVRADLKDKDVSRIAFAFGAGLVVNGRGPQGSLRRAAAKVGCHAICIEAGEALKFEPSVIDLGVRGIHNVLVELGMVEGEMELPIYQARVDKATWVRAGAGGLLQLHVGPGDLVEQGQPLATTNSLMGYESDVLEAPVDGVVMGLTTLPAVAPGDPVCHIAVPRDGIDSIRTAIKGSEDSLLQRVHQDLSTNVHVSEHEPE